MGMLQRLTETVTGGTPVATIPVSEAEAQVAAERAELFMVKEAYADLERLYAEDIGWRKIGDERSQLTARGRDAMAAAADVMATGNPLIKSGVNLRIAYVWGLGVTVGIADDGAEGQDVNAVWTAFWEEPSNRIEFTSSEAQARYERRLATRGEAFWAFPTEPRTGRVRVRHLPARQIVDRICDPEDAATVWYYKRVWTAVTIDAEGKRGSEDRVTYYPALGYYPARRPTYVEEGGHRREIRWDAPVRHVGVNQPDEEWRGLGDALAALPWARMDKEFLEDLAVYMRALTKILGQVTGKNSRTARAAANALRQAAAAIPAPPGVPGQPGGSTAGSWAATDPNTAISLVSKSGAQIDAESHRPLATMVAAALEVPLTMLLGDPGQTGARAVAETLDQPTELKFHLRRGVHQELFRDVADYVIDQAVLAPAGPLRGTVTRDGNRLVITLPEGDDRTVEVKWPEFSSTPLKELVDAVAAAEELPPLEKFKLYARAFGLDNIDDLVEELTDDEGRWIDPMATAGQAAVDAFRDGRDPAQTVPAS